MTKEEARGYLAVVCEALKHMDEIRVAPGGPAALNAAVDEMLADPDVDAYTKNVCKAYIRGRQDGDHGLTPGQSLDREFQRQKDQGKSGS